jgi:hypothetical protein
VNKLLIAFVSQSEEDEAVVWSGTIQQNLQQSFPMSETSTATATATPASIGTKEDEKKEDASAAANATTTAVKKNYTNWPLRNIKEPHANDVLYGRGGEDNGTGHPSSPRALLLTSFSLFRTKVAPTIIQAINGIEKW